MAEDRYLEVSHEAKYGWGGNTILRMFVLEETEDELRGLNATTRGKTGGEVVVRKENVAGWREFTPWNPPSLQERDAKRAYENGWIDEDELESRLEKAMGGS